MSEPNRIKMPPPRRESLPQRGDGWDDGHDDGRGDERSGVELAYAKPKLKRPRMFKVVLLNDDYTPMDFVVHALQRFFHLSNERAAQLTFEIHTKGRGVCGVFSKEIAETKMIGMNVYARMKKHPLLCVMEPSGQC